MGELAGPDLTELNSAPTGAGMTVPMMALPPIAGLDRLVPAGITPVARAVPA